MFSIFCEQELFVLTLNSRCVLSNQDTFPSSRLIVFLASLLYIFLTPFAGAQQNNSSISGSVRDVGGAAVVSATVILREPATGLSRSATISSDGSYKFASLNPGTYEISINKVGFKTFVTTPLTILVSQDAMQNATLLVGSVDTTVTVEAATQLVDNDSAVVGQVIESKQLVTYPLNGRDFLQLATLSAGVNPAAAPSSSLAQSTTNRSNTTVIVSGNRESSTSYLLDGIEMRDDRTGALTYQASLDALEEFRVQRSFFQAENGFHPAIVNVITKSGTNQFHLTAWDFLRNTNFDGSNYFSTTGPDPYHQNQFGAVFSGPIIKDKLHFLFDYEGVRYKIGVTSNGTFPDERQLSGDFTEPIKGIVAPIYDPATPGNRTQFPGNIIPPGRISQVAKNAIALLFPSGVTTLAQGQPNYHGNPVQVGNDNQYIGRLDMPRIHMLGHDTQLAFRFAWLDSDQFKPGLAPLQGLTKPIYARNVALQATTPFSSNLINVFRVGYQRDYSPTDNIGANTRNISAEIGLQNTTLYAPDWAAPVLGISGYSGTGAAQCYNLVTTQNAYVLTDNVTLVRGRHTFKTGLEIRDVRSLFDTGTDAMGSLSFTGPFTAALSGTSLVKNTGNPIADFLLGYPSSGTTSTGSTHAHFHYGQFGFFLQDDWKLKDNFMLQAGVRYEPSTYPYSEENNTYIFDQQTGTELFPSLHEVPRGLLTSPHHEIGPRLGFSYSPGAAGTTTIRAGVGLYFDMEQLNELQFENFGPPFYYLQSFNITGNTLANSYQLDANTFPYVPPVPVTTGFKPPSGTSLSASIHRTEPQRSHNTTSTSSGR
jgi:hypothetical protein